MIACVLCKCVWFDCELCCVRLYGLLLCADVFLCPCVFIHVHKCVGFVCGVLCVMLNGLCVMCVGCVCVCVCCV